MGTKGPQSEIIIITANRFKSFDALRNLNFRRMNNTIVDRNPIDNHTIQKLIDGYGIVIVNQLIIPPPIHKVKLG